MNVLAAIPAALPASIPSPSEGEWHLGPIPIRAYALAIMLGILVAIWFGNRRWLARGGKPEVVVDIAIWAVPFGIVGARIYHVITDWDRYFGEGQNAADALRIWEGGLSIWGAIAFGALGGWIGARTRGVPMPALADALAPGILLAQAIGRWGNYFNQELFGRPTDLPWALEIDAAHRPEGFGSEPTFHPTFLYESLWALVAFGILLWADKRFQMGHGRVFALYVALYTLGRTGIESLRIDTGGQVEGPAREILGMRINGWVSVALFVGAIVYIAVSARLRPGREDPESLQGRPDPESEAGDGAEDGEAAESDSAADDAEGTVEADDAADDADAEGAAEGDAERAADAAAAESAADADAAERGTDADAKTTDAKAASDADERV